MLVRSLKIIDHPEYEKNIIENEVEKEVKHGIPYITQKTELHFPSQ